MGNGLLRLQICVFLASYFSKTEWSTTWGGVGVLPYIGDNGTNIHWLLDDIRVARNGLYWYRVFEVATRWGSPNLFEHPEGQSPFCM